MNARPGVKGSLADGTNSGAGEHLSGHDVDQA
jgi:hypothetical protein